MSRDYTKLRTFIAAYDLAVDVYELTRKPPEERYGLQSQIRRAAVSTPTNIVEGSVRLNALGSAGEVRYLMGLCFRLKMIDKPECNALIERYTDVVKGLSALITRIDEDLTNQRAAQR